MKEFKTYNEIETENIGYHLAKKLKNNQTIVLTGDLGAGKTRFVRGIARFFGVDFEVSSPTFTIVNEYTPVKNNELVTKIFHFDTYRLTNGQDFENTIGTEYFNEGLCIIEWGEIIKDILPQDTIYITITIGEKENERFIKIEGEL